MKIQWVFTLVAASLCTSAFAAGPVKPGDYKISTYDLPGTPAGYGILGIEQINDFGEIAGYIDESPYVGFIRKPNGSVSELVDPLSTGADEYTYGGGINDEGTVVGYFYDTANAQYSGFLYKNGAFTTYNVPGLPQYSATVIIGINNLGSFCGYYEAAPAYAGVPYVNTNGHLDTNFPIAGSTFTQPTALNDLGEVVGLYVDSANVDHGFIRARNGKITLIDVPGAAAPGTVLLGLNDLGWTSGHFWDAAGHEHGFVRSPEGVFSQIDVPGANTTTDKYGTAGGGINNFGVVVGHYDPANGSVERGYIATPKFDPFGFDKGSAQPRAEQKPQ